MKIRRLFFLAVAGFYGISSLAGQVWHYQPVTGTSDNYNDKVWGLVEYRGDPTPEQLSGLAELKGYQKLSVVIPRGPAPALEHAFVETARKLKARGIALQYKFYDGFPAPDETKILKQACANGAEVFYINNAIPTELETAQLQELGACVRLEFALGRYPRYVDVADFKRLQGLKLAFLNDYFPAYSHMDNLNLINTPVSLRVARSLPDEYQITLLNMIEKLAGLVLDLDLYPDKSQYALLSKLKRPLAVRWSNFTIRDEDVAAFKRLTPERLQISGQVFEDKARFDEIRNLPSEIVVEHVSSRMAF